MKKSSKTYKLVHKLLTAVSFFLSVGGFSQNPERELLLSNSRNKELHDTIRIGNIIGFSYSWPAPSFDEMIPLLDEGFTLAEKNNKPNLAKALLGRKIYFYTSNGRGMEAFAICNQMLQLGEKTNDNHTIGDAYYHRGTIFRAYNMLNRSVQEQIKALDYYLKTNDQKAVHDAQYLLGWYAFNSKEYELSLSNFLKAYYGTKKIRPDDMGTLGEYSGWVGNAYGALKNFDSALYYRRLSMGYFSISKDKYGYPDAFRYLGNIYQSMKKPDSALYYFKKSQQLFEENQILDRKWLMECFMAGAYYELNNYGEAAKIIDNLLDTTKGTKDLLSLYLANKLGGKIYEKTKEYPKAIRCYKNFMVYKDSIEQGNKQGAVTELDAKLKFEMEENAYKLEQAKKDAEALREKEKQNIVRNFLLAGFLLMAVFVVIYYRNYKQKQKDNKLLEQQKNEIEFQKKEIQDSINYAQNIQASILPETRELEKHFGEMFVFYKPKDVVSGDFFWHACVQDKILIAAADCTGHGVPGAFMSMIGSYELNNSVQERGLYDPAKILEHINSSLKKRLKQNEEKTKNKDGMDIALCSFEPNKKQLNFAGANRPLFIVRGEETLEVAPNKTAIGGYTASDYQFSGNTINLQSGDCIYMYTDGYSDQFGGEKNKKLTTRRFKELLKSVASKPMKEQYRLLEEYFYKWKGNFDQLDDVLVIGIKII